jgi:hypothetical protein
LITTSIIVIEDEADLLRLQVDELEDAGRIRGVRHPTVTQAPKRGIFLSKDESPRFVVHIDG